MAGKQQFPVPCHLTANNGDRNARTGMARGHRTDGSVMTGGGCGVEGVAELRGRGGGEGREGGFSYLSFACTVYFSTIRNLIVVDLTLTTASACQFYLLQVYVSLPTAGHRSMIIYPLLT